MNIDNTSTMRSNFGLLSIEYNYTVTILKTVQPVNVFISALKLVVQNGSFTKTLQTIALKENVISLFNASSHSIQASKSEHIRFLFSFHLKYLLWFGRNADKWTFWEHRWLPTVKSRLVEHGNYRRNHHRNCHHLHCWNFIFELQLLQEEDANSQCKRIAIARLLSISQSLSQ